MAREHNQDHSFFTCQVLCFLPPTLSRPDLRSVSVMFRQNMTTKQAGQAAGLPRGIRLKVFRITGGLFRSIGTLVTVGGETPLLLAIQVCCFAAPRMPTFTVEAFRFQCSELPPVSSKRPFAAILCSRVQRGALVQLEERHR